MIPRWTAFYRAPGDRRAGSTFQREFAESGIADTLWGAIEDWQENGELLAPWRHPEPGTSFQAMGPPSKTVRVYYAEHAGQVVLLHVATKKRGRGKLERRTRQLVQQRVALWSSGSRTARSSMRKDGWSGRPEVRMNGRSDVQDALAEQHRRPDWPSADYLMTRLALQVARQLDQLRQQQRLSYEQLAGKAGTSKAHVIRMLSGDYEGMSNKSLAKLASALGAEIDVRITRVAGPAVARPHTRATGPARSTASGVPAVALSRTARP